MTKLAEYLETRDKIIWPALEELKQEYESHGYQCRIATEKLQGTIYFSRIDSNNVKGTVSIFLVDDDWVVFNKLNVLYSSRLHLDEITPDQVKEKIREALEKNKYKE